MTEFEKNKNLIVQNIQRLCAHCVNGHPHDCPVQRLAQEVERISGVPLIVNNEFRGIIFQH